MVVGQLPLSCKPKRGMDAPFKASSAMALSREVGWPPTQRPLFSKANSTATLRSSEIFPQASEVVSLFESIRHVDSKRLRCPFVSSRARNSQEMFAWSIRRILRKHRS
jgi:hypothetical protein